MKTFAQSLSALTVRQATSLLLIVCTLHLNIAQVRAMSGAEPQTGNVSVGPIAAEGVTTVTVNAGAGPAKAVINWQDLNISDKQTLQFVRDGGAFVVLNRDLQSSATRIDGTILGNQGHIIIVNQNGVVFGPTASVQAAKFTAGAMTISDQDFLTQDTLKFIVTDGAVKNLGTITAEQVALIGREVINRGIIQTPAGGFVLLASADEVYLAESQSSPVRVRLASAPESSALVVNEENGKIESPAGTIILAAGDLYVQALDDLKGLGASVQTETGRVGQFGTVSADAQEGNGGRVALTAGEAVILGSESVTSANAAQNGDGGQVIVFSPQTALFSQGAQIQAKGGSESGSGGFAELSGKAYTETAGDVDLTAANGRKGTFLLDPRNIKVVASGTEEGIFYNSSDIWKPLDSDSGDNQYSRLPIEKLEQYLSYSSVILETDYSSRCESQTGWVWFDAGRDVQNSADTSLTVNAKNWIKLDSGIRFTGSGDITLNADTDITVNSAVQTGGTLNLNADRHITVNAPLTAGGNMNLIADNNHDVNGDLKTSAAAPLTASGHIDLKGNDIDLGAAVTAGGNLTITGRDCLNPEPVWGNIHARSTLTAGGNIEISVTGEEELYQWVPTGYYSGYYITTIRYNPGTITLDGDVTAGGNIALYNDTYATNVTGNGVTLQAGGDILLKNDGIPSSEKDNCTLLQGEHYLALIAGGQIQAENTLIQVTGSTLKLQQTPDLNLKNFTFGNQNNTDLIANSTGGSVIIVDAANGGKNQNAADQWKSIESTAQQNITLQGSGDIRTKTLRAYEGSIQVTSSNGDILGSETIAADRGNITLQAKDDIILAKDVTAGGNIKMSASDYTIYLGGNTTAAGYVWLTANTRLNGTGDQKIQAGTWMRADGSVRKTTAGDLNLAGGSGIYLADDVSTVWGDLIFENPVIAFGLGHQTFDADGSGKKLTAKGSIQKTRAGDLTLDGGWNAGYEIELGGDVTVSSGSLYLGENGTFHDKTLAAAGSRLQAAKGDIRAANTLTGLGDLTLQAGDDILVYGDLNAAGHLAMQSGMVAGQASEMTVYGNVTAAGMNLRAGNGALDGYLLDTITIHGDTQALRGSIDMISDDHIRLDGQVFAAGHIGLYANADKSKGGQIGDVRVGGDLTAGRHIQIDAAENTIYLGGSAYAIDYIHLMANTKLNGFGDQVLHAGRYIQADGYVRKCTAGDLWLWGLGFNELFRSIDLRHQNSGPALSTHQGNLWVLGKHDIQIAGDITTFGPDGSGWTPTAGCFYGVWPTGGVLLYSMTGRIYSGTSEGLNVNITGSSDHKAGLGVVNPLYYFKNGSQVEQFDRLAIAVISEENLVLGPSGSLNAFGRYYSDVDDRDTLFLLDSPAEIGGYDRNPGVPFDAAVYLASTAGNVQMDMKTRIRSCEDAPVLPVALADESPDGMVPVEETVQLVSKGAMVIDAYDSVLPFGTDFRISLAGNGITSDVGDRLEVVSRITEWRADAYGRLPYADPAEGEGPFPAGYNYVLRGAGLENPEITDGRAWVFDEPETPVPAGEVAPLYRPEEPRLGGCPVEMDAAAAELGIHSDQLQVAIANSLALNPTLNPCSACAQLIGAANILKDSERMAAVAAVFEQIAPADMPFTPEMGAVIASAFAQQAQTDTRYASAMEFVDAFVRYVTILDRQLQAPIGDPVAFALNRYGSSLMSRNSNIAAYLLMQIQQ
ncbi:MAG: filamentous hemagglutinin N-terminal domain-containing protein [Anaerohalosphaeraceae bacterium]